MSLTYIQPPNALVEKNPFRSQGYEPTPIPSFLEIRGRLPVPVLPEHEIWTEMYWRAWELAWSNLRRPRPQSGFVNNFVDNAYNENVFMWDTAFTTQYGLYARHLFPCMEALNNFYAKQHNDGFICREINANEGFDYFYPFDPNSTGPNILAWAEWRYYRVTGDDGRLSRVFWPLLAYHRWCRDNRTWQNGLYWATGISSAMDNQLRIPDSRHHHRHWSWIGETPPRA